MYEWQRGSTMLTNRRMIFTIAAVLIFIGLPLGSRAYATSCEQVAAAVNKRLTARIDQRELTDVLRTLNRTDNRRLPPKFVTKREARERGWKPGRDLWSVPGLRGASIGGDHFRNREDRLPAGKWREADLDYQGGRRGGKRLVFSGDGRRFITVDHYRTFMEIPLCQ